MSLDVARAFAPLKAAGFRRTGRTWERPGDYCALVVRLERSRWAQQYYLYAELFMPGNTRRGPMSHDASGRVDDIELARAIDAHDVPRIAELVPTILIPMLDELQRPGGFARLSKRRDFGATVATPAGRAYFGWEPPPPNDPPPST